MSTKDRHALNHWWSMLVECCNQHGGETTAGQAAKHAGVARNTAKRWLEKLVTLNVAGADKRIGKNGFDKTSYYVIG